MPGEPFLLPIEYGKESHHYPDRGLGSGAFQQFVVRQYRRRASCREVACEAWRKGWATVVDESTPDGRRMADYIRHHSGRRFILGRTSQGWTQFTFPPEQTCFQSESHYTVAAEPPVGLLVPGDHRARTGDVRRYDRVDQLVDDWRSHDDTIAKARSRAGTAE